MSITPTNEQITKLVEDMRAQLDTCVPKGQAYRVKWHDVKEIIAVITTLQQRLTEANDFNNDVVEREAAVCPEDVGFDEYIRTLQSRLAQVEKERDTARRDGRLEGLKEADQVSCTAGAIRERIKLLESQL